jgi:hypothetical protein
MTEDKPEEVSAQELGREAGPEASPELNQDKPRPPSYSEDAVKAAKAAKLEKAEAAIRALTKENVEVEKGDIPFTVPSQFKPTLAPGEAPPYVMLPPEEEDSSAASSPAKDPGAFRPEAGAESWDWHPFSIVCRAFDGFNITFITLAAILFLVGSGTVFYKHQFATMRSQDRRNFCDYAKYYVCGKMAFSKDSFHVYDKSVQSRYLAKEGLSAKGGADEFIHYPPIDFPLMSLFTADPIAKSYELFWTFGNVVFLFGTWSLARASRPGRHLAALFFFWLAAYGAVPMTRAFLLGQTSLFLTGIIALYIRALIKNRALTGGLTLALTAIKPQYTVFLLIPALVQRRFMMILSALAFEGLLLLAAYRTIGQANLLNYPSIVMHAEQTSNLAGGFVAEMVNMRGLAANIFGDGASVAISTGAAALAWLLLAALWMRFCPRFGESGDLSVKLLLTATVLFCVFFSLHTHLYDCLIVSCAYLVIGLSSFYSVLKGRSAQSLNWPTKILAILLMLYPLAGWIFLLMPGQAGAGRTLPFALYNGLLCLLTVAGLLVGEPGAKKE